LNKSLFPILVLLIFFSIECSKTSVNSNNNPNSDPLTTNQNIPGIFYSEYVDDEFFIFLDLPEDYSDTTSKGFHVVFLLDGNWYFDGSHDRLPNGGTVGILSNLTSEDAIPSVITVAIGYPEFPKNHYDLRRRDFFYPHDASRPTSGGGDNFYRFLKDELIPKVDSQFNTQEANGRTLIGHSGGGYFALYSLFQYRSIDEPLFINYLAISPSNWYHNYYVVTLERLMSLEISNTLPSNLYMSIGGLEESAMQIGFDTIVSIFNSRNYNEFEFYGNRYRNGTHGSVVRPSIADGMTWFFNH
jgi:predicted alpha/beta superfamily hydrolase